METRNANPSKKRLLIKVGVIALAVVLFGALVIAAWYPTSAQNKKLGRQILDLEKELKNSKTENANIKNENDQLKNSLQELTEAAQSLPTMSVVSQGHYNGTPKDLNDGKIFYSGDDFILIKVEVVNNSKANQYFNVSALKLKDSNNVSYPYYTNSAVSRQFSTGVEYLPKEHVELKSQPLSPGEKVAGTLIFYGAETLKHATLLYGEQSFDLELQPAR